jgi:hypothetical protein
MASIDAPAIRAVEMATIAMGFNFMTHFLPFGHLATEAAAPSVTKQAGDLI